MICLPKNVLFFSQIFHIYLPTLTVTSILTWPENDVDMSCIYSNGLSNTGKIAAQNPVPWILRYSMDGTGFTFSKNIFEDILSLTEVVSGFFCIFCQYKPIPSVWATEAGPMCKCRDWSKVEKKQSLKSTSMTTRAFAVERLKRFTRPWRSYEKNLHGRRRRGGGRGCVPTGSKFWGTSPQKSRFLTEL